jgi:transcriptional regulator with GAF, ATPase, and Fis domain
MTGPEGVLEGPCADLVRGRTVHGALRALMLDPSILVAFRPSEPESGIRTRSSSTVSAGTAMTDLTPSADDSADGQLTPEQVTADAADLQASLSDLAGLVTGALGLQELLAQVATFAAHAIPGAEGAGVTLLRADRADNRIEALAASAPFVTEIDEIQYGTVNEGPCITAALERRTVRSGSLGGEKMWPRFGPRVGRLGVHSALSLPLLLPGQVVGAINVYAHDKDVFDEHAAELGELFAKPAAVSVHNARILAQALTLTAQLQTALSTRPVIDQAVGLLRGRSGGTAEEAFARLRAISQTEHTKLADVAQRIVDEAVRRARARHSQP